MTKPITSKAAQIADWFAERANLKEGTIVPDRPLQGQLNQYGIGDGVLNTYLAQLESQRGATLHVGRSTTCAHIAKDLERAQNQGRN